MRIRFTEFFRKDEEEFSLYVIQEINGRDYTVHISNGEGKEVIMLEQTGNRWNMLAHNIPEWVKSLKSTIVRTIEYRMLEVNRPVSRHQALY